MPALISELIEKPTFVQVRGSVFFRFAAAESKSPANQKRPNIRMVSADKWCAYPEWSESFTLTPKTNGRGGLNLSRRKHAYKCLHVGFTSLAGVSVSAAQTHSQRYSTCIMFTGSPTGGPGIIFKWCSAPHSSAGYFYDAVTSRINSVPQTILETTYSKRSISPHWRQPCLPSKNAHDRSQRRAQQMSREIQKNSPVP